MMTYTLHYFPVHCDIEMTRRPYGNEALIAFYPFDFCDLGFGHSPESEKRRRIFKGLTSTVGRKPYPEDNLCKRF